MTSKKSSPIFETVKHNISKRNKLKGGGIIEINKEFLDKMLYNDDPQMESALQIISNDKIVSSDTIPDLKVSIHNL